MSPRALPSGMLLLALGLGLACAGPPRTAARPAPPPPVEEVYAHGPDVLYRYAPETREVRAVGRFHGCGPVLDLAVDGEGEILAVTSRGLLRVDPQSAACTLLHAGRFPNSLSFVPAGVLEPESETLVGYRGDAYLRIDLADGSVHRVGSLGDELRSSGDLVSIEGVGTWLTVRGPGCERFDCLAEIDPRTGSVRRLLGSVGYEQVFGLAWRRGLLYGFTNRGVVVAMGFPEGSLQVTPLLLQESSPTLRFYGAGSTTRGVGSPGQGPGGAGPDAPAAVSAR